MHPPPFTVELDRSASHITAFLSGELDRDTVALVEQRLGSAIGPGVELVWADVAAITFCGSAGLALFLRLDALVREHGGSFVVYRPSASVMRTIQLCGLHEVLSVSHPVAEPSA